MMRRWLRPVFCGVLRVFFRRVETYGLDRVPRDAPVLFVLNHPNALVDPALLVCRSPRPISFLAKEPLFRMPVIGFWVRAFESLPVYRRQDARDPRKNRETFERARELLARGRAIAIFPEGTSHSAPQLRPLKSGAARLALGTAAVSPPDRAPVIVPVGLNYAEKTRFRSAAAVVFGAPIPVPRVSLGPQGNPPARALRALTREIERGLGRVTWQGASEEAFRWAAWAERLWTGNGRAPACGTATLEARRAVLEAWERARACAPERWDALRARLERHARALRALGLEPGAVDPATGRPALGLRALALRALPLCFAAPLAALGAAVHVPAALLARALAVRFTESPDMAATVKILAGMVVFPLAWAGVAAAAGVWAGPAAAAGAAVAAPVAGACALWAWERARELGPVLRAHWWARARAAELVRISIEERALRAELRHLAHEAGAG